MGGSTTDAKLRGRWRFQLQRKDEIQRQGQRSVLCYRWRHWVRLHHHPHIPGQAQMERSRWLRNDVLDAVRTHNRCVSTRVRPRRDPSEHVEKGELANAIQVFDASSCQSGRQLGRGASGTIDCCCDPSLLQICQAISNQMTQRDPLRPCMTVIEGMLVEMVKENPSFKPSAGRMSDNDMEYDSDMNGMAALRRRLKNAHFTFARYKSEYTSLVMEALELEETMKNYERGAATDWVYVSTIKPPRVGPVARPLDKLEWIWRCSLRPKVLRLSALIFGCMTAALLIAEATLLPTGVDLSFFSYLINVTSDREILVQICAFIPVMYMCACTYFSLFKLGMFTYYYFAPKYTNAVSLLMICSMVARYAPPVCYNYLGLIRLEDERHKTTIFEQRMGVPVSGDFLYSFNRVYPLFMVIYTAIIASNALNRIIDYFGSWRRFRFEEEGAEADGCDPSGMIIIRKERSWMEQGSSVGEHLVPLARNFGNMDSDMHETEAMLQQNPQQIAIKIDPQHPQPQQQQQQQQQLLQQQQPQNFQQQQQPRKVPQGPHGDIAAKYMAMRDQRKQQTGGFQQQSGGFQQQTEGYQPQQQPGRTISTGYQPMAPMPRNPEAMSSAKRNQFDVASNGVSKWRLNLQDLGVQNFGASKEPPKPSAGETLDSIFDSLKRRDYDEEEDPGLRLLPR